MKKSVKVEKIDFNYLAEAFKSMAHPERLAILHLMCKCGCTPMIVKDIYMALQMDQSTASRHLMLMKKGGLLKREVRQGKIYYGFNMGNNTATCMQQLFNSKTKMIGI